MAAVASSRIASDVLSDQKAIRTELLKIRFADTIRKANAYLNDGVVRSNSKAGFVRSNMKEEKRKARLQPAKKVKIETENRIKLEKRREAARRALEEMEKRVVVEDNFKAMQELNSSVGSESRKIFNPVMAAVTSSRIASDVLPDQKAIRTELLKIRFANTIMKANAYLNDGVVWSNSKAGFVRSNVTEEKRKARLQPAKKVKTETENRIKLEKRREAARRALEEMEKRVVVEDNFKVMQELNSFVGSESRKIFKAIGLRLKREEVEEE